MIAQTRLTELSTETSLQTVLRAIRLSIKLRISDQGCIKVSLPPGMAQIPSWLKQAKEEDEWAFGFAVALVAAVERSGGDPMELLNVKTLFLEGIQ